MSGASKNPCEAWQQLPPGQPVLLDGRCKLQLANLSRNILITASLIAARWFWCKPSLGERTRRWAVISLQISLDSRGEFLHHYFNVKICMFLEIDWNDESTRRCRLRLIGSVPVLYLRQVDAGNECRQNRDAWC